MSSPKIERDKGSGERYRWSNTYTERGREVDMWTADSSVSLKMLR